MITNLFIDNIPCRVKYPPAIGYWAAIFAVGVKPSTRVGNCPAACMALY